MVIRPGRAPIRSSGGAYRAAIAFLRSLGTSAHVWLPGASGVSVASLPSNNYLLSDGSTGFSTVDGVDGLTLDGMGSLGSELVTNGGFNTDTSGWTAVNSPALSVSASGVAIQNAGATNGLIYRATTTVIGKTYKISASIVYGGVGVARVEPSNTIPTTVGGGYISVTASGAYECFFTATATTTYIVAGNRNDSNATHTYDNISVKEYTGTHLTQPTTANKPLVRRGMLNLLTSSSDLSGAGWVASNATRVVDQDGTADLVYPTTTGVFRGVYKGYATGVIPCTSAFLVKPAGFTNIAIVDLSGAAHAAWFNLTTGVASNVLGGYTASIAAQANGYYLCVISGTGVASSVAQFSVVDSAGSNTATTNGTNGVYVANVGLFQGTWTAAQILAEGGIPNTTATAASNPSAGKYWWSFNGSKNSLLSGNLGITNACTIVIAGRVNSLAPGLQMLCTEDTNGAQIYINNAGRIYFSETGVSDLVFSAAGVIVAGVPFVITARLSGGNVVLRLNGVQVATAVTGETFSAITGVRLGTDFAGTGHPLNGALGWVVPSAVGLSDADCLTVERLVGSQFPGMAVF